MQTSIYSLIFSVAFLLLGHSGISQISITDFNVAYEDDFTGFDGNDDPPDWTTEDVTNTSDWRGSNNGSSNAGGKWSYGDTGSGASFDGSLGFLPSSTRAINAEIQFVNNTGSEIEELEISYVAEHWRNVNNGQTNGWTVSWFKDGVDQGEIPDLTRLFSARPGDDTGENPGGGPWEAVTRSDTLTGLDIPSGSTFTIRFFGDNGTGGGARQGVAIDNFSLTAIGAPTDDPLITLNPTTLTGFEYEEGDGPSASQSFELSGSDLDPTDGDLTVDASGTDYEVSLDDNTFHTSMDVAYTGGELSSTDIYVRLKEGLDAGEYNNQEIVVTGGGADAETLTVSGEVTAASTPLPSLTAFNDPYEEDFTGFVDENSFPAGWSPDDNYGYDGAFPSGAGGGLRGEGVLGFQLTGSAPNNNFTATLQLVNDIGSTIENLEITYLGKVGFETRSGTPNWTVRVNGSVVAELGYSTAAGVDEMKTFLLTGLNIPTGDTIEIEWFTTSEGTSGQRRQIGATDVKVEVLEVAPTPDPEIALDPTSLTGFEYQEGDGPSASQSFELSGSELDPADGNLTVNAGGTDCEVSLDDNTFNSSVNVSYSGGELAATDVFVRLKEGLAAGDYNNQEIEVTGGGADAETLTVSGEVTAASTPLPSLTAFNDPYEEDFTGFVDENSFPAGWSPDDNYGYDGAFPSGAGGGLRGEGVLGFQLTGSAPNNNFTATLQLVNDIGSTIENLEITYLGKVGFETRSGTPNWTVRVNGSVVAELGYSTAAGLDEMKNFLLTGLNIPTGDTIEIKWFTTSEGTSGQRRQIGVTDVEVVALDAISAPDAPEFDLAEGTYFEDQTVFVSNFGDYASSVEVRYTTDGTAPDAASILYDHGSGIDLEDGNGPVTLRAIAIDTNTTLESDENSADYSFPENVPDIAAFRAGDVGTLYRITGEVVLLHIASFQNRHFVRDNSGSLIIYDQGDEITTSYMPGQGITGFTGERNDRNNGALEVMEAAVNPGSATSFGNDISPVSVQLDELDLDFTGNLVKINEVDFVNTGVFSTGTTYFLTDPSISGDAQFRTDFFDADYIGDSIPENTINLTALVIGFGSDFQLVARSTEDFETVVSPIGIDLIGSEDPSCAGAEDGSIEVAVSGGQGNLSLSWEGPGGFVSDQFALTDLQAGTYSLTVTDDSNQEGTFQLVLSEPDEPALSFFINGEAADPSAVNTLVEDTEVTVVVADELAGVSPFDVDWSIESVDNDFSGSATGLTTGDTVFSLVLPAGNYTLDLNDISDAEGCSYLGDDLVFTIDMLSLEELEFANFLAQPSSVVVAPGSEFDITIQVELSQLTASAAEIHLEFDTAYLEVVAVKALDWNTGADQTVIFNQFDNEEGTIDIAAFQLDPPYPSNTTFDFYTITFLALKDVDSTEVMHLLDINFPSAISFEGQGILDEAQSAFVTIDKCLLFELEATSEPSTCFNNADGSIELTPLFGEGPFDIAWDNGQEGLILEDVLPGEYGVTVTDANGCVAIEVFEVGFIPDVEAPEVTCLESVVVLDAENACAVHIDDYTHLATATDNCTAEEDLTIGQIPSSGLTQIAESITVFITAMDESGNIGYCSFLLNLDNFGDEPALDCPPTEVTVERDPGLCEAYVELTVDFVVGCEEGTIFNSFNSGGDDASGQYPLGSTEVVFDLIEGGDTLFSCTTLVVVEDNQMPVPGKTSLASITPDLDSAAACGNVVLEAPTALTDCAGLIYGTPSESDGLVPGSDPPAYEFTDASFSDGVEVVWTYTNPNSGAIATQTQFVQVIANEGPEISCPVNKVLYVDPGSCELVPDLGEATASDICGGTVISDDREAVYTVGVHTITYVATNDQGQQNSCEQTLTVLDNQPPSISCPEDEMVVTSDGSCQFVYTPSEPVVSDNCGISQVVNNHQGPLSTGENEIVFIVFDVNGNSASCIQIVTVIDESLPVVSCPDNVTIEADEGSCVATGFDPEQATASYNCGDIVSIESDVPAELPVGANEVTHTATAENGMSANCIQTVDVIDTEAPSIECPDDVFAAAPLGSNEVFVGPGLATASDNCEVDEISNDFNDGGADASGMYPVGTTEVVFTATDPAGLTDQCVLTVVVELSPDTVTISGNVSTSFGYPVPDTEFKIFSSTNFSVFSDGDGDYSANVLKGSNVTVIPERDFDWMNGVTTLDLVLYQRHILQIDTLIGPYVLIGGDANGDGVLSTFDLVLFQNLIIEGEPAGIPGITATSFVKADYQFNDPQNPFAENYPELASYQGISNDLLNEDWIAIKLGDANGDAFSSGTRETREAYPIAVRIEEHGDMAAFVFSAAHRDELTGFQLEWEFDQTQMEFEGFDWSESSLENLSGKNFFQSVEEPLLRSNWWMGPGQELESGDEYFRIYFRPLGEFDGELLQESLELKTVGQNWYSEVYDRDKAILRPHHQWSEIYSDKGEYILHQNTPNPFSNETVIPFELPAEMEVEIEIVNTDGQILYSGKMMGSKGYNSYPLRNPDLPQGVLFYRLNTDQWSASRKMIRVE